MLTKENQLIYTNQEFIRLVIEDLSFFQQIKVNAEIAFAKLGEIRKL